MENPYLDMCGGFQFMGLPPVITHVIFSDSPFMNHPAIGVRPWRCQLLKFLDLLKFTRLTVRWFAKNSWTVLSWKVSPFPKWSWNNDIFKRENPQIYTMNEESTIPSYPFLSKPADVTTESLCPNSNNIVPINVGPPSDVSWFINPINYSYKYHKP